VRVRGLCVDPVSTIRRLGHSSRPHFISVPISFRCRMPGAGGPQRLVLARGAGGPLKLRIDVQLRSLFCPPHFPRTYVRAEVAI
jgi:hypothetical protein